MINKKIKKTLILGITAMLLNTGCTHKSPDSASATDLESTKVQNHVTISAVGDIMVHNAQLEAQHLGNNSYDFRNNFKHIKDIISNSDLSIANLETTINPEKQYSGYPSFNSPTELLVALKDTGFDILSTINNHTLDTGYTGVISTLNEIEKLNLKALGTKTDSNKKNYLIEEVNGIKIGVATFSYGDIKNNQKYLNGIPSGKATDLLNVIDGSNPEKAFNTIKTELDLMKSEGAECTIIGIHWGIEYNQTPTSYQKQLAQMLANEGVDIILGSHPHVVQPIEFVKSECHINKETLVVYSMGNIISNQREEEMGFQKSENGILPIINIEKDDENNISITNVEYIPTWVNKDIINDKTIYEIIPICDDISKLSKEHNVSKTDLEISLKDTTSLMKDTKIKLYEKNNN